MNSCSKSDRKNANFEVTMQSTCLDQLSVLYDWCIVASFCLVNNRILTNLLISALNVESLERMAQKKKQDG